ncbi:MAG: prepilin-type N-terminal cleavage/methylation domain-containing protein [Verrucomicrobiae bacterium]|nr:prepilin-type N-terminal cleavage/methylation domain-containing protein [Verrucomicrobiae bacterium]
MRKIQKSCESHFGKRAIRNLAFTLIELLFTVGILSLLASFILPALSNVRNQARTIKCMNNLRQIGIAVIEYEQDHDGFLPAYPLWIIDTVEKYAGRSNHQGRGLVYCPMDKNPAIRNYFGGPATYVSYGYNFAGLTRSGTHFEEGLNIAEIASDVVLVADSGTYDWGLLATSWDAIGSTVTYNRPISIRHNGGSNILFADGHVELHDYREIAVQCPGYYNLNNAKYWNEH